MSQIVEYYEAIDGRLHKIAIVHRYLRKDGSLGASGKPDPKLVRHDGTVFMLKRQAER